MRFADSVMRAASLAAEAALPCLPDPACGQWNAPSLVVLLSHKSYAQLAVELVGAMQDGLHC